MLLLLAACAKPVEPPPVVSPGPPRLAAPVGDLYTRLAAVPSDPLVATAMGGRPWDEVLAGVAAAIALQLGEGRVSDRYAVRWHAVRAGYPYPVGSVWTRSVAEDQVPPDLPAALAALPAGVDVGLARARGPAGDNWVLLAARPGVAVVPRLAREQSVGTAVSAVGMVVSDPLGQLRPSAASVVLDQPGEWMFQARDASGVVATLPVWVGETTPEAPPVVPVASSTGDDADAFAILGDVWGWYGRNPPARDPVLDSVARARLRDALERRPAPDAARQLRVAGFVGEPGAAATCRAPDVTACLDSVWWSPEARAVVAAGYPLVGLAAARLDEEVVLVVVGAS